MGEELRDIWEAFVAEYGDDVSPDYSGHGMCGATVTAAVLNHERDLLTFCQRLGAMLADAGHDAISLDTDSMGRGIVVYPTSRKLWNDSKS